MVKIFLHLGSEVVIQDVCKVANQEVVYDHPYVGGNQFSLVRPYRFTQGFFGNFASLQNQLGIFPRRSLNTALFDIATVLYG